MRSFSLSSAAGSNVWSTGHCPGKPDGQAPGELTGGEGGIRTPDRLAPMPHFECGAFNHSATSPGAMAGDSHRPRSGRVLGEDGGPDKARLQNLAAPAVKKGAKTMEHLTVRANGAAFHVARTGR